MPTFVISGKIENAGQAQSTQKTSGCGRLVSWGKEVSGGGGGLKTKQTEPMGVYTVHTCTSKVLTF